MKILNYNNLFISFFAIFSGAVSFAGNDSSHRSVPAELERDSHTSDTMIHTVNSTFAMNSPMVLVDHSFTEKDLMQTEIPHQMNSNKSFVLNTLLDNRSYTDEPIHFRKYGFSNEQKQIRLNQSIHFQNGFSFVSPLQKVFPYEASREKEVQYTLNFADPSLFGFWKSPLFAQDEIQVLEHPMLGYLRERLSQENPSSVHLNTGNNEVALIRGAKRYAAIDVRGIYGNAFAYTAQNILSSKISVLNPATTTHIIAMAAPRGQGPQSNYRFEALQHIYFTALTAFTAAKTEAESNRLVINTGNWGTGAFGNNPIVMACLQILAAKAAAVDQLNYYTVDPIMHNELLKALDYLTHLNSQLYQEHEDSLTIGHFLKALADANFKYGISNGT